MFFKNLIKVVIFISGFANISKKCFNFISEVIAGHNASETVGEAQVIAGNTSVPLEQAQIIALSAEQSEMAQGIAARISAAARIASIQQAEEPTMW